MELFRPKIHMIKSLKKKKHTKNINEPLHKKTKNLHMRKQGANQLCSNCTADQRLCFCDMDSIIPLLLVSKVSTF